MKGEKNIGQKPALSLCEPASRTQKCAETFHTRQSITQMIDGVDTPDEVECCSGERRLQHVGLRNHRCVCCGGAGRPRMGRGVVDSSHAPCRADQLCEPSKR